MSSLVTLGSGAAIPNRVHRSVMRWINTPSEVLAPCKRTLSPAFNRLGCRGTTAVTGMPESRMSSDSPPGNFTLMLLLPPMMAVPDTVALVIVWFCASFIRRCPSPNPRKASGKIRNSVECSFPSVLRTAAEAMKSLGLMSASEAGMFRITSKLGPSRNVFSAPLSSLVSETDDASTDFTVPLKTKGFELCASAGVARCQRHARRVREVRMQLLSCSLRRCGGA